MQSQNSVFTPAVRHGGEQNVWKGANMDRVLREGGTKGWREGREERKGEFGLRISFVALDPTNLSGTS